MELYKTVLIHSEILLTNKLKSEGVNYVSVACIWNGKKFRVESGEDNFYLSLVINM